MKKLLIPIILILLVLTGCGELEDYNINDNILLTDMKVSKLYEKQIGKNYVNHVVFSKDGKKYDLIVEYQMSDEIKNLVETASILQNDLKFDVISDGERVGEMSLSNNRR